MAMEYHDSNSQETTPVEHINQDDSPGAVSSITRGGASRKYLFTKFMHTILLQQIAVLLVMLPFISFLFSHNLADLSTYHIDETIWIPYGNQEFKLFFITHDMSSPLWHDDFYTYGTFNPNIGKYIIGLGTYAAGYHDVPYLGLYNWDRSVEWNIAQGQFFDLGMLIAARVPIAVLGILSCSLLYWIVTRIATIWHAVLTMVALLSNRLFLIDGRSAMLDMPCVFFGLLALFCLWYLIAALRSHHIRTALAWALGCGFACGLAVGSKLTGALAIIACLMILMVEWYIARRKHQATAWPWVCMLLISMLTIAIFIGSNPFLYTNPIGGMRHMLSVMDVLTTRDGALASNDIVDKCRTVIRMLLLFAPLRQAGLTGDALVLAIGIFGLSVDSWKAWRVVWAQQHSTVLLWIAIMFVGLTLWLPIEYPRYILPLYVWTAFLYAYGLIWMAQWVWIVKQRLSTRAQTVL